MFKKIIFFVGLIASVSSSVEAASGLFTQREEEIRRGPTRGFASWPGEIAASVMEEEPSACLQELFDLDAILKADEQAAATPGGIQAAPVERTEDAGATTYTKRLKSTWLTCSKDKQTGIINTHLQDSLSLIKLGPTKAREKYDLLEKMYRLQHPHKE